MEVKVSRNKKNKVHAQSELKISAKKSLVEPVVLGAEKRKKPLKRGTPKTLNQLYPQAKSSPGLTSLQTKPLKKPETKLKLKTKKLKCKDPEKAKPESSQPWMDVSKFTPNIKNESKITKQSYEAWVNTTPAAVMKQIQRIKAENAQQNRVSPEKKCSPLRIRNLDVSDDRYKGKLKIFNKHTIAHLN